MIVEGVSKLQHEVERLWNVKNPPSWSWVLTRVVKIVENYPSGVTKTIILSELYQEFLRTGGKLSLSKYESSARGSSVAAIHEHHAVGYDTVLEAVSSRLWTLPGTTTSVISLRDPGHGNGKETRQIEMYLHRKFQDHTEVLMTHILRLTCCRLQPVSHSGKHSQPLWILPSEHLIILLQPEEESCMMARFVALSEVMDSECTLPCYIQDTFAKVSDVCTEEVVHSPDGTAFRRLVVILSSGVCSVQLVLWDHYTSLARLWSKGDLLFLERPYAKPVAAGKKEEGERDQQRCLEIGPATVLYLSPFKQEEEILPSQISNVPVHVKKTDQGRLDFSSYPHRLMVADLVPRMIHGVMLAWCDHLELTSQMAEDRAVVGCCLHIRDGSGSIVCEVYSADLSVFDKIHPHQWVLLTGLSSHMRSECGSLFLLCDTTLGGSLHCVSSLVGWLRSPCLLSHMSLSAVASSFSSSSQSSPSSPYHFTIQATLMEWKLPTSGGGGGGSESEERTGLAKRIHSVCGADVIETDNQTMCDYCKTNTGSWKWHYNLQCTLLDCPATGLSSSITGNIIHATLTPTAAEMFLQVPVAEFISLSQSEQLDILNTHCNHSLLLCLSRIEDGSQHLYQINALCKTTYM